MTSARIQKNKSIVWNFWQELNNSPNNYEGIVSSIISDDVAWQGPHPLNRIIGKEALLRQFWQPLLHAIPDLHRRCYIFLGGQFKGDEWITGTGDYIGTFVHDWLGIPANKQSIHLRFGEICKLIDGKIVQTYTIFDLADLIRQAGVKLFPPDRGKEIWIPGPMTGNGLLLKPQNEAESQKTHRLVESMIFDGLLKYDGENQESMGLSRYWHPEMVWYGPAGIGTAYGIENFKECAQKPILTAFPDRAGGNHQARFAEGVYAMSTGWPSLQGTHLGDYLGVPATNKQIGMRIIDVWRRQDDLLVENWVLIDFLDLFLQFGIDLLGEIQRR